MQSFHEKNKPQQNNEDIINKPSLQYMHSQIKKHEVSIAVCNATNIQ